MTKKKISLVTGTIITVAALIFCAFYFSSECSVRYGNLPLIDGVVSLKDSQCTCLGIKYQERTNPEIVGKSAAYMCAGIVLNRYEE